MGWCRVTEPEEEQEEEPQVDTVPVLVKIEPEEVKFNNGWDCYFYGDSIMPGWIKCSEQMPKFNSRVLVYLTYPKGARFQAVAKPMIANDKFVAEYWIDGNFYHAPDEKLRHVTHWMPLPEAPSA